MMMVATRKIETNGSSRLLMVLLMVSIGAASHEFNLIVRTSLAANSKSPKKNTLTVNQSINSLVRRVNNTDT